MSKPNIKFSAVVTENCTLEFKERFKFQQFLHGLRNQEVYITVKKATKNRSLNQNSYYWGVVVQLIADHCGYNQSWELESIHELLKQRFLPRLGKLQITKSTSELTTLEFEEYTSKIRQWADIDLGLFIPLPNENIELF